MADVVAQPDMLAAGALDTARTDNALAVGEQDDLEQQAGRIGRCTAAVVGVTGIEVAQVEFVVNQGFQRLLERSGQKLPFEY